MPREREEDRGTLGGRLEARHTHGLVHRAAGSLPMGWLLPRAEQTHDPRSEEL